MTFPPLPNFFLVGAPKAGTTSLYRYLNQHPAVYTSPIKEPCFFAPEVVDADPRRRPSDVITDWSTYLTLFAGVTSETAIGEGSVAYLASRTAPQAIQSRLPHARILMMLRDPAERLFSHYAAARAAGATDVPFTRWLDLRTAAESDNPQPFGPIEAGCYARHLRRYLDAFPPTQVRVLLYDDYVERGKEITAEIFAFLSVDDTFAGDFRQRHNVTLVPRWPRLQRLIPAMGKPIRAMGAQRLVERVRGWSRRPLRAAMTPAERTRAIAIYADDIRALQELIHRDLSGWLEASPRASTPTRGARWGPRA